VPVFKLFCRQAYLDFMTARQREQEQREHNKQQRTGNIPAVLNIPTVLNS